METNKIFDEPIDFSSNGKVASIEDFFTDDTKAPDTKGEEKPVSIVEETIEPIEDEKEGTPIIETPNVGGDDLIDLNIPKVESTTEELVENKKDDIKTDTKDVEGSSTGLDYKAITMKLMEQGVIDRIEMFETEEGEKSFDEMEIDEEIFSELIKHQQEELKEKLLQDKISVEGTSEFTQKLIEIEKNGGNVQQALASYQAYKNPLEQLDLSKVEDQRRAVALKMKAQNLDNDSINRMIRSYESDGILEEQASKSKSELEAAFNKQMDMINQNAIQEKENRKQMLKEYRGNLSENLSKFELNDNLKRKLLDAATKESSEGGFELDELYSKTRQNPELAADLVLFLTNREEYIKQVANKELREKELSTMKKFKIINKGKTSSIDTSNKDTKDNDLIDITKLI